MSEQDDAFPLQRGTYVILSVIMGQIPGHVVKKKSAIYIFPS